MKLIVYVIVLLTLSNCLLEKLPKYNIDIKETTVSGLSSGGAMTQQLTTIYSSIIKSSATFAGIPYACAEGESTKVLTACTVLPSFITVESLINTAKQLADKGLIDPLSGISKQEQYFYSGTLDTVVKPGVNKKGEEFASKLGAKTFSKFDIKSEHTWPTVNYGNECSYLGEPYISKCDYQASDVFMKIFLGDDYKKPVQQKTTNLIQFDQGQYTSSGDSMNRKAYIYVPTPCLNGEKCKLHVNFHGCSQNLDILGDAWVKNLGLNEIAEANNIVILYPQTKTSLVNPSNPNGCWDFWGYTSPSNDKLQYLTKEGPQIKAIYKMMQDLTSDQQTTNE